MFAPGHLSDTINYFRDNGLLKEREKSDIEDNTIGIKTDLFLI